MYLKTFAVTLFTLSAVVAFVSAAPQQSSYPYPAQQPGVYPYAPQPYAPAPAPDSLVDLNPPHYDFKYEVSDPVTGDQHSQQETRNDDVVQGSYSLVEPDGSVRIVNYHASDAEGFVAEVQKAPGGSAPALDVRATPSRPKPVSYHALASSPSDSVVAYAPPSPPDVIYQAAPASPSSAPLVAHPAVIPQPSSDYVYPSPSTPVVTHQAAPTSSSAPLVAHPATISQPSPQPYVQVVSGPTPYVSPSPSSSPSQQQPQYVVQQPKPKGTVHRASYNPVRWHYY